MAKNNKPKPKPTLDDWLQTIDPGGWASEEDKKLTVVPVEENLYEKYIELLNSGELLPGTTFELFEKLHHDLDVDIISKIKKRAIDKKRIEGLASLLNFRALRS